MFHFSSSSDIKISLNGLFIFCANKTRTVQKKKKKMKFSIKDFLSKCDQIHSFLWIWSYLLKKSLMENFIFCAVQPITLVKIDMIL